MKERNFYFNGNMVVLNVLDYRRSDKSLVSYFVTKDMSTGNIQYVIEIACKAQYVTPEYWWDYAKDLDSIKIKSFGV